jgi:hypothetical protein
MAADEQHEVEIITVGKPVDDKKAVWDRWPGHPANYDQLAGEVFISDMRPYDVDRNSPGIRQKLGEQAIRELSPRVAGQRRDAHDEVLAQQAERREQLLKDRQDNAVPVPPPTPPVPMAQAPTVETTPPPPPPSEAETAEAEEDDGEEQGSGGTATGTLARPSRGRRPGGSMETPPER